MTRHRPFPSTLDLECPKCFTAHTIRIEADEDGPYAELETERCNHDTCHAELCSECSKFSCSCCGLTFCKQADHIGQEVEDEDEIRQTRRTLLFCKVCCEEDVPVVRM